MCGNNVNRKYWLIADRPNEAKKMWPFFAPCPDLMGWGHAPLPSVFLHPCTYTYTHTYIHTQTHKNTNTHTHRRTNTHIYELRTHIHTHTCTYTHTNIHTYKHTHIHTLTSGQLSHEVRSVIEYFPSSHTRQPVV